MWLLLSFIREFDPIVCVERRKEILTSLKTITVDIPLQVIQLVAIIVVIGAIIFFFRYRASIKKHLDTVKRKLSRGLVYRDKISKPAKIIKALELHPAFVEEHLSSWQLCSLGQYLSTLRFFTDKDNHSNDAYKLLERELYVVMASLLMQSFGPRIGPTLLPMLGTEKVESLLGTVASKIISYIIANVLVDHDENWDPQGDMACLPMNVMELIGFVNLNQKLLNESNMGIPPIEWMKRGEVGFSPTYYTPPSAEAPDTTAKDMSKDDSKTGSDGTTLTYTARKVLIPNPFVIEEHFEAAIAGLEDRIQNHQEESCTENCTDEGKKEVFDPDDRSTAEPTPINPVILPDLYIGWGDAKLTHTKREILRNRLFAVLLTKLSYNYARRQQNENIDSYFVVQLNEKDCLYPDEFIEVLLESGHTIEVCPRSAITTFGIAVCIKEDDDSWTNVPVGFFLRTGYERYDQRPAYFSAPHGGMDLKIKGPLVGIDEKTGKSRKCDIQFYMAVDGLCGWHSNHNVDCPWIRSVSTTDLYTNEQALTAVRMTGVLACTFNSIGTEMSLPLGGYGLLGVCNDTAAVVDFAIRGSTNMYPLLSTGRFLMHTAKYLTEFCDKMNTDKDMKIVATDARRLASAACSMDSDIHCSPTQMIGATRRFLANYPTSYFQITEDSKQIMERVSNEYMRFLGTNADKREA